MKHLRYLHYVVRHRWFVFVAACRLGIPWRGFVHDLSKFRWSEWKPYADYFYGRDSSKNREANKDKKPYDTGDAAFDYAWLLHQKRNRHHWQYWMLPLDDGGTRCLPMPDRYRREMVADWIGAGMAITGRKDWRPWYERNKSTIRLHPETRAWVEAL
jgi:hypothetical protein